MVADSVMAEGEGFEPSIRVTPYTDLANQRLQPLGHPSAKHQSGAGNMVLNGGGMAVNEAVSIRMHPEPKPGTGSRYGSGFRPGLIAGFHGFQRRFQRVF